VALDPFAFRELLKQDNQDRFQDPAELKDFISDRDTQLREVVLTTIMRHEVSARQRLLITCKIFAQLELMAILQIKHCQVS
jgi:hypothetical protein